MTKEPDYSKMLHLAGEAAKSAAGTLELGDRKVMQDLARDVKIEADQKLHRLIKRELEENSPFPVLSEEDREHDGTVSPEPRWILDPLDGSLNFSRDIPLCCISIGLWKEMNPLLGVVFDFHRSELFSGLIGEGVSLNGRPVRGSGINQKSEAVLCTGFPSGTDFSDPALTAFVSEIRSYKKVRLLGSAALSLAYVASGRADAYRENDIALWDVAAGIALVQASNGEVFFQPAKDRCRLNVKAGIL